MFRNIVEINNPGPSNHFEQLVAKCVTLIINLSDTKVLILKWERMYCKTQNYKKEQIPKGRPYPHHNVVRIGNYPHHNVVRISYYPHHNVVRTRYYPHHTLIAKDTKEKFKRKVSGTLSLVKTPLKILTPLQILKVGALNFWSSQGRSKF